MGYASSHIPGDWPDFDIVLDETSPANATFSINEQTKGIGSMTSYVLSIGGVPISEVEVDATAAEVESAINSVLGVRCPNYVLAPKAATYFQDYEMATSYKEYGSRTSDIEPFCGKTASKNTHYIFAEGDKSPFVNAFFHKYICFAYFGEIKNKLYIKYYMYKLGDKERYTRGQIYSAVNFPQSDSWGYTCVDMKSLILSRQSDATSAYLRLVKAYFNTATYYIDTVSITATPVTMDYNGLTQFERFRPYDGGVQSATVTGTFSDGFNVTLVSRNCAVGFPLLAVEGAQTSTITADSAVHTFGGASVQVTRMVNASMPPGGTFSVAFGRHRLDGVSATLTAEDMRTTLETLTDIGSLKVTRTGPCIGYDWTVEWLTRPGDQPQLEIVDTSDFSGTDAMVWTEADEDGGLFFDPIPGDLLRTVYAEPQVSVSINKIASICAGNCSFQYSAEATPTITDVQPTSGSSPAGTILEITGSGFDDVNSQSNSILIGGTGCDVTAATTTQIRCSVGEGPAGTHEVLVFVDGKGAADDEGNTFEFTYDFDITGFSPSSGSTAGGQELSITGTGFGTNITASVGSSNCEIISANYSRILCLTTMGSGTQDITVTNGATTVTYSSSSYLYDSSITPEITSLSSTSGSPVGGETVTISGSNFGSASPDNSVHVGKFEASVLSYSDSEIDITLPPLPPGQHDIVVMVEGIGNSDNTAVSAIQSILEVSNVFPKDGSQAGGTLMTITGQGFDENYSNLTKVMIEDKDCVIETITSTVITCSSPDAFSFHTVTNQGVHPTFGVNYAWLPATVHVYVGDIVTWSWEAPERVTTVGFAVHQTETPTSQRMPPGGFSSHAKSPSGSFSYQFNKAGTYYYWSGPVNNAETIFMRGTVMVHQREALQRKVTVTKNGHDADYTMSGNDPVDNSNCGATYDIIDGCMEISPPVGNMNNYYLTTSRCVTPIVSSVEPNIASAKDVFVIKGQGFSDQLCQNIAMFGEVPCNVTSANSTVLTCEIEDHISYAPGEALKISVRVLNLGEAIVEIDNFEKRYVVLVPYVNSVEPPTGSIEGGTNLTITGSGFLGSTMDIYAHVNNVPCIVTDVAPDRIVCMTGKGYAIDNVTVSVSVRSAGQWLPAGCEGECMFSYTTSATPVVSGISQSVITQEDSTIVINGAGFESENTVYIGDTRCQVFDATSSEISCYTGSPEAGEQPLEVIALAKGRATGDFTLMVQPSTVNISLPGGSTAGGQNLIISGFGFMDGVEVDIGGEQCVVSWYTSHEVMCLTPEGPAGSASIEITSNDFTYPSVDYMYTSSYTPVINSVSPSTGYSGDNIVIAGANFGGNISDTSVKIGGVECMVTAVNQTSINCVTGAKSGGEYEVELLIYSMGKASNSMNFTYELGLSSISPVTGSFSGRQNLTVSGSGFDAETTMSICGQRCEVTSYSANTIYCLTPGSNATGSTEVCDVSVTSGTSTTSLSSAYTYDSSLTPEVTDVSPVRGPTVGGTVVTITGSGFGTDPSAVTVSFAGTSCPVATVTDSEITCTTDSHSPSIETKAVVEINGNGIAKQTKADFQYIDVWSSRYTWGGSDPPVEGDFVVIPSTMTVLLDTVTPVLALLLIDGGKLIFDEKDVELHAEKILINKGGVFQVGTEEEPFMHKATIMLHGHVRSQELPIYGTKMLAVRNGILDLHGKPHDITWTLLDATADAGASTITLQLPVDWEVGDKIVIATTGHRHTQGETEVRTITAKSGDQRTLTLDSPLQFKHLGETLAITGGYELEARAEVGLLTRNIVVRGSDNADWHDKIEACPDGFDTGEFAVQTCFQGRFGDEIGTDEFGSQIMFHAPSHDSGLVIGRISNVEVTHAGQAYRLGRYAIHFHLNGDMAGSYVKNCAIHKSFNRAVNIHATNYIVVENNVIHDIMGGALFLEDGIEIGNVFEQNLALFVKQSTSLQNDDITPAAFWVTNANNTYRHNRAAGGTHFGFWYRMHAHPDGASFDKYYCPQKIPMGNFYNNTVHSQGWFGIWIFQEFYPMENGWCLGDQPLAAKFYELTAWNNEKGAEWVSCGAVQFIDFFLVNNEKAGIEMKLISNAIAYSKERGAELQGGVIAASPDDTSVLPSSHMTQVAIVLPYSRGLGIHNMTFVHFDGSKGGVVFGVTSITGTSSQYNGGFTYQISGATWINTPNKVGWRWVSEGILKDLDGTTCGTPGCSVIPNTPSLPPAHCQESPDEFSVNPQVPGAVCDSTISLHRWAFNNPTPSSMHSRNVTFTNSYGTTVSMYAKKRVTHKPGWHTLLISGETYKMEFNDSLHLTNISFTGTFYDLKPSEYVIFTHNFTQRPDRVRVVPGTPFQNASETMLDENSNNGDWYIEEDTNMMSYIVSGRSARRKRQTGPVAGTVDRQIDLDIERCFYQDCVLPVFGDGGGVNGSARRPPDAQFWEMKETWADAEAGWGGNYGNGDYGTPLEFDDVIIPAGKWVVLRTKLPRLNKLYVYGVLEFEYLTDDDGYYHDLTLSCTHIVITGRFIIGWNDNPFLGNAVVELRGDHLTPDIVLGSASIGSKVIAAFGGLEIHGKPHNVTWTRLASSAMTQTNRLMLSESVDWSVGDEIVITPSGFTPWEVDIRKITAISADGMTLTLNQTLQYTHTVNTQNVGSSEVYLGGEVGLLSRNVKIVGADYPKLFKQSFGARILIGTYADINGMYTGYARLSDFECYHCGQEGWTDFFDPRYSLAFLNTGDMIGSLESYVTRSSFFHSFSPGIGLFGANRVRLEGNVIYHTVGSGIIDWSVNNVMKNNLVTLVVFTGTYNGRVEERIDVYSGFDILNARLTYLEGNVVAGSERLGFHTVGEPCPNNPNPVPYWSGNTAHSCLAGVAILPNDPPGHDSCTMWANFTTYRCFDFGFYYQSPNSFELVNVISIDNKVGLYDMVMGPSAKGHSFAYKYVTVRDSVFVGTSDGFDCQEHKMPDHEKDGTMLKFSEPARSWSSPGGGRVGQAFATFSSGGNNAPLKPWANIMAYNALYGIKHITGNSFINFATACGKEDYAITTMPKNDDLIHPMRTAGLTLTNVKSSNKIFIHRPNLGKVNPSDCVDMDCDAYKKCILTDSDGSLLGSRGTVISQSEWEWNGNRRRGLGDYRIPRTLQTTPDGARIPVNDFAPEKGIIRDSSCVKDDNMQSWVCGDTSDYEMAIIESMDSDTETRRLSPVAVLGDGYLDLINGPQDHGWCFGYTCQKRLSTFGVVVATGKTYEVHFTGTSPQDMRLHLLNSLDRQAYVFKIFYAVPMRLDIYVAGRYIEPKNSATDGTGRQITVNPSFEGEYHPDVLLDPAGSNFWDPTTDLLYVLVRGQTVVDIKTSELIVITFGVPAMTVDDFFGENIVNNLAIFLGIPADKIKVASAGGRSRRRLLTDTVEFVIEISNPPSNDTSFDNTTVSATNAIDSTQFANVTATLINAVQLGILNDVLNTTLSDISITEPVPDPSDPSWAIVTASLDSGVSYSVQIQVPDHIEMVQRPVNGREYSPFIDFPILHMLDTGGNHVGQLGSKVTPWEFTASLSVLSGSSNAFLTGESTVNSLNGWTNFTSLGVSHEGSYRIDIAISSPSEAVGVYSGVSFTVHIHPKTLTARFVKLDTELTENEETSVEIEIIDDVTYEPFKEIFWKGHRWFANVSLHMPEMYSGSLLGDINTKMFENDTSTAMFNVSFSSRNQYFLHGHVWSKPKDYIINVVSEPIDVMSMADKNRYMERSANITLRFPYDYDVYVYGKEMYFAAAVMNQLTATNMYNGVTMHKYSVSKGSILASFVMSGPNADVTNSLTQLESLLKSGFTITFNGMSFTAVSTFTVDGSNYGTTPGVETLDDSGLEWWEIFLIVLGCLLVVGITVALVLVYIHHKNKKKFQTHSESSLQSSKSSKSHKSGKSGKSAKSGESGQSQSQRHAPVTMNDCGSQEDLRYDQYIGDEHLLKEGAPIPLVPSCAEQVMETTSNEDKRKDSLPPLNKTAWRPSSAERRIRAPLPPIFIKAPTPVVPLPVQELPDTPGEEEV